MRNLREFDVLILPGWHNSEPGHWQSEWQSAFPNMTRVEQDDWETPVYSDWAAKLTEAVAACRRPVLLIAHSLGTSLVMRWAHHSDDTPRVAGAFLVAASDRDRFDHEPMRQSVASHPCCQAGFHSLPWCSRAETITASHLIVPGFSPMVGVPLSSTWAS